MIHIGKDARVCQATVRQDIKRTHVTPRRVIDIQDRFIRRECQSVGAIKIIDQQFDRSVGQDAVHAIPRLFALFRCNTVGGIGKINRTVRSDHDIIRAVETLPAIHIRQRHRFGAWLSA
jgi:hypothetical protein